MMLTKAPLPGPVHPDVMMLRNVLLEIPLGELLAYAAAAKTIGLGADDPAFRRRARTARAQLRRSGVNVVVVPGEGFLREKPEQTLARMEGRERRSMNRKARKVGESLAGIDVGQLAKDQQYAFFAQRTLVNLVYCATQTLTTRRMLAAVRQSESVLPMQRMLEVLTNGNPD